MKSLFSPLENACRRDGDVRSWFGCLFDINDVLRTLTGGLKQRMARQAGKVSSFLMEGIGGAPDRLIIPSV